MCGIVGYIGKRNVLDVLLAGLARLEYRGYDSAGIAVNDAGQIKICRATGKLCNLSAALVQTGCDWTHPVSGIGHVRWATHGAPTVENAHPHTCNTGDIAVVHNGIIENFAELRAELTAHGCVFRSQTDTEVIAHLVSTEYTQTKDLRIAVTRAIKQLRGVFAICVMHRAHPDQIVVARRNAPLIVGIGDEEAFIGSDIPAIIEYTQRAVYLADMQVGVVSSSGIAIFDTDGNIVPHMTETLPYESMALSRRGYPHFMLKEIHEQPDIIRNMLCDRLADSDAPISMPEINLDENGLRNISRIEIVACGTSLHAGMIGRHVIEELCGIPVDVRAASEYIYSRHLTDSKTMVIAVSQSGETADTLTAVRQARDHGAHILVITNRADSAMARLADSLLVTPAGIEVSVAATKSFTAQLMALYIFALYLAQSRDAAPSDKMHELKSAMKQLPALLDEVLADTTKIEKCADMFAHTSNFIYIARGINLAIAYEGALKLKEISYINATGYAAGELKHGPIAMLDQNMPVLSIMMNDALYEKMVSNSQEAAARQAKLIALTSSDDSELENLFDIVLRIPETHPMLTPLLTVVPLQLLAYHIAKIRGRDIDQPRNLAKSVTVE